MLDQAGQPRNQFASDERITVSIIFECFQDVPNLQLIIELVDHDNVTMLRSEYLDDPSASQFYVFRPGLYQSRCVLPRDYFGERRFYVSVYFTCQDIQHVAFKQIMCFDVEFRGYNDNRSVHSKQAYLRPRLTWQTDIVATEPKYYPGQV